MSTIDIAKNFAENKFKAVNKKNHFLRVCGILQNELNIDDEEILTAAILHDTLEDTDTTYEELVKTFSKIIADLVQEVSHPKNYTKEQKQEYYQSLKTISPKAKLIKLADFADNLRNIIEQRKREPEASYHNQYILLIRDVLINYEDSSLKNLVLNLTNELETYVKE
jgi:(p)ppGpp synthase/HD superfamily hydrolase